MDDKNGNGAAQDDSFQGYATPGEATIEQSTSSAVPAPSQTSEERLTTPQGTIQSIGETPGDANPALAETLGAAQGQVSTADLLRAREGAEEQGLRAAQAEAYADQASGVASEYEDTDAGRPNWPNDRREEPVEYMDSPRADMPLGAGTADKWGIEAKGRVDWTMDRAGTQASAGESRSGLPPVGMNAEEDKYEEREFGRPTEASEIDQIAPGMVNLPPKDE
ncbi:MAG TPA: hypothetical protein VGE45_06740 [Chloroflexia bacterium]|jgi:hypothetical protein